MDTNTPLTTQSGPEVGDQPLGWTAQSLGPRPQGKKSALPPGSATRASLLQADCPKIDS